MYSISDIDIIIIWRKFFHYFNQWFNTFDFVYQLLNSAEFLN